MFKLTLPQLIMLSRTNLFHCQGKQLQQLPTRTEWHRTSVLQNDISHDTIHPSMHRSQGCTSQLNHCLPVVRQWVIGTTTSLNDSVGHYTTYKSTNMDAASIRLLNFMRFSVQQKTAMGANKCKQVISIINAIAQLLIWLLSVSSFLSLYSNGTKTEWPNPNI